MTFYCHPVCTTCKKARDFLDSRGLAYTELDIREHHPDATQLADFHQKSGLPLRRFFNTSGQLYRGMGLSARLPDMTEEEQLQILATDGMLVRRPILVHGDTVLVGFNEQAWAEALG